LSSRDGHNVRKATDRKIIGAYFLFTIKNPFCHWIAVDFCWRFSQAKEPPMLAAACAFVVQNL
jgi:hypothetical protein